jgi:hypothetical protein
VSCGGSERLKRFCIRLSKGSLKVCTILSEKRSFPILNSARNGTTGAGTLQIGNEFGAGVTLSLFQGLLLAGAGYDFGANGNQVYYFFGVSLTDVYTRIQQTISSAGKSLR